jgi:hypothetical protein
MATVITDYQVISGGGFILDASTNVNEQTFTFKYPPNFAYTNKPILAYWVTPLEASNKFRFFVNNQQVFGITLRKGPVTTLYNPFVYPVAGEMPWNVPVRLLVDHGLDFANIIIWYQVNLIPTVPSYGP